MKLGSSLLAQLERCGYAAKLADEHREISDGEFRDTRLEIARAFHANDQAQLPEAHAALSWLMGQPGKLLSVGEPLDLIDPTTGEVLVTGKPGAVLADPALVVFWSSADRFDPPEPEDDLGMVAMGLAASQGQSFRVADVAIRDLEVFPRLSPVIEQDQHAGLWERIRKAAACPRIACPGEWCGACRQAPYCEAWLARARTALVAIREMPMHMVEGANGVVVEAPKLDLTNDNSGAVMETIKFGRKVLDMAEEQVKSFVRKGGTCVVAGKEYYLGQRDGRKTVNVAALEKLIEENDHDSGAVTRLKAEIEALIKQGEPFEMPGWRKAQSAAAARKR